MQNNNCRKLKTECQYCHTKIVVWSDENKVAKWVCPNCKLKNIIITKSRRRKSGILIAPEGKEFSF